VAAYFTYFWYLFDELFDELSDELHDECTYTPREVRVPSARSIR
jgi:hypothetical protein